MTALIGRIVLQPTAVRPGESVRIEVFGADDPPSDGSVVDVSINGVPGAVQYLQFPTIGQRRLTVLARMHDGQTERQVVLLDVTGAPLEFPSINSRRDIAML